MDWRDVLAYEEIDERRKVADMCCGIQAYRQCRSLILVPGCDVRVFQSGHTLEAFFQSPSAVTNTSSMGNRVEMTIMGKPLSENDSMTAESHRRIGLDPDTVVAFGTAAHMDNAAFADAVSDSGIRVSAAITGGVRGNGGRAGDPASFDEAARPAAIKSGTIVIMVAVDAPMTDRALVEAMAVVTQAKSRVMLELEARSLYSPRVATGSGTDQAAVICRSGYDGALDSAGPATGIGHAIGRCVHEALMHTLDMQSGMTFEAQCDPYVMLSRFGISDHTVHDEIRYPAYMSSLLEGVDAIRRDPDVAAAMSAALHVADEVRLGTVSGGDGMAAVKAIAGASILKKYPANGVEAAILDGTETAQDYMSVVLALVLKHVALDIQGAERWMRWSSTTTCTTS